MSETIYEPFPDEEMSSPVTKGDLSNLATIARRWYELLAGKIYGTLKYSAPFFEIKYSWYIKHHHTLKQFHTLKRVTAQMNHVVEDHLDSGFLKKVEYRKVKEPGQELDFLIRYFVGGSAKESINRIQGHISDRRKKEVLVANSIKESQNAKIDEISGVRVADGIDVPLEAKVATEPSNLNSDGKQRTGESLKQQSPLSKPI